MANRNNYHNMDNNKDRSGGAIDSIISRIQSMNSMSEYSPKIFADIGGDADKVAKSMRDLNTTQLRKFFDELKQIELQLNEDGSAWVGVERKFYMMKPMLAYAKGRKLIPENFFNLMAACMKKIDVQGTEQKENYNVFVKFVESIVAYHKYYYG